MPNMGSIINRAATKAPMDEATAICNCRIPEDCPLQGSCNIKGIVYEAEVTPVSSTNGIGTKKYIGLINARVFKRWLFIVDLGQVFNMLPKTLMWMFLIPMQYRTLYTSIIQSALHLEREALCNCTLHFFHPVLTLATMLLQHPPPTAD